MTTGDEGRAREALEEGNRLLEAGDFDGALAAYDRSLELRPDDPRTLSNRGVALSELGRSDVALAAHDRSLELRPDHADTHYNRGNALGHLGQNEEALAAFDRSLELRPDHPHAHENRGVVLGRLSRNEEALAAFDRALQLGPDNFVTHYCRGNALGRLGRNEEALAAYDRALELRPDDPDTVTNRGGALIELGRHQEALAAYDRALELRPDHADSHYNRGTALGHLDRNEEALAAYDRALALSSDDPGALTNRGVALERLGRYEEALAASDRSLALRPDHPETLNNRGVALSRLERHRQAVASYQKASRAFEKRGLAHAVPHANRGEALYRLGWFHEWHLQQAVSSFRRALGLDAKNSQARNGLGVCLLAFGHPGDAATEFSLAVAQAPDELDLRYNYAVACQRDGRRDRAKSELARILDKDPTFEPARRALDRLSAPPTAPDMWEWWTGGSTGRGWLGFGLLAALAVLVGSSIVDLLFPSLDGPALPWQYYVAALAVVAGALVLPAVRQFKAFGVELEPQPPRAAGVQLEPLLR